MQPLVALRALRSLIQDPEQTDQVFIIIRAMAGDALERAFDRFRKTPTGQKILAEKRDILDMLEDRQALAALPAGSLARTYLAFVENEHLSANGLVDASHAEEVFNNEDLKRFGERMRDTHDLWHVLTGYGRDTFGEACLLAFTYAQTRNRGLGLIALIGAVKLTKAIGPGVKGAMWQAYRAGKRAAWLPQQDWEALLPEPLSRVRQQLNINPPDKYQQEFERLTAILSPHAEA